MNQTPQATEGQKASMAVGKFLIDNGLAKCEVFDGVDSKGKIKYKELESEDNGPKHR